VCQACVAAASQPPHSANQTPAQMPVRAVRHAEFSTGHPRPPFEMPVNELVGGQQNLTRLRHVERITIASMRSRSAVNACIGVITY
jgi:hypothetical protein